MEIEFARCFAPPLNKPERIKFLMDSQAKSICPLTGNAGFAIADGCVAFVEIGFPFGAFAGLQAILIIIHEHQHTLRHQFVQ